jgi:hypothetical protein
MEQQMMRRQMLQEMQRQQIGEQMIRRQMLQIQRLAMMERQRAPAMMERQRAPPLDPIFLPFPPPAQHRRMRAAMMEPEPAGNDEEEDLRPHRMARLNNDEDVDPVHFIPP